MLTFLFWNMGGKLARRHEPIEPRLERLSKILANLTRRHEADVLLLAECPVDAPDLLAAINAHNPIPFSPPDAGSLCQRITIYTRFPTRFLKRKTEGERYTGRELRLPGLPRVLLFGVHFGSKLYQSGESQGMSLPDFRGAIRMVERAAGHERTVVVGDFNMNPFEFGVVDARGLNAVMTREIASRKTRTVDGMEYPFFYNPMWSCFGDSTHERHAPGSPDHEPAGTCYYPAAESKWFYWNMFDQVLLRPDLLPCFKYEDLKIEVTDGTTSLLNARGRPDREAISDHLPVRFRLHLMPE